MRIGILGYGLMGGKLGTLFARASHEVVFRYARRREKLKRLAKDAKGNTRAGTQRQAAQDAGALRLAVHWSRIEDVLRQTGGLPMNADDTGLVLGRTSSSAEAVAKKSFPRRLGTPAEFRS